MISLESIVTSREFVDFLLQENKNELVYSCWVIGGIVDEKVVV
jgi:Trm5-related predicted tRNA methylase